MDQAQNGAAESSNSWACESDCNRARYHKAWQEAVADYYAERARADQAEAQLRSMTERCRNFESDVVRYIRENEAQRTELQEARAALRSMAYLVTETEMKAKARNLAR